MVKQQPQQHEAQTRSSPKSQKEAVFEAVTQVLGTDEFDSPVELEDDQRQQVRQLVFDEFKQGKVAYSGDLPDDKTLYTYTGGLISNWLRKDDRLNGGMKYQPKNPGMRAGSGDEQLKAMRALLAATVNSEARVEIQAEIDKRMEQLKPKPAINYDHLPPELKKYIPQ